MGLFLLPLMIVIVSLMGHIILKALYGVTAYSLSLLPDNLFAADPPSLQSCQVLYDSTRYYRVEDVSDRMVTVRFALPSAKLEQLNHGTQNDRVIQIGNTTLTVVDRLDEVIELRGAYPVHRVCSQSRKPAELVEPFS